MSYSNDSMQQYFPSNMEHSEGKRTWLSMDEVLEELDEPVMSDSDDDLEDLQAEEKERDEDRYAFLGFDTAPTDSSRTIGAKSSSTLTPETGGMNSDSSITLSLTSLRDSGHMQADLSTTHLFTLDSGHTESDLSLTHLLTSGSGHMETDPPLTHSLTSDSGHMETDLSLTHSLTADSGHIETDLSLAHSLTADSGHIETDLSVAIQRFASPPFNPSPHPRSGATS